VFTLAMIGGIDPLAKATSLLLLAVFVVVNVGLIVLKFRPDEPRGAFEVPWVVPLLGALVCLALVVASVIGPGADRRAPIIAGVILVVIVVLFVIVRPRKVVLDEESVETEQPATSP